MWRVLLLILLFATQAFANPDTKLDLYDSIQLTLPQYADIDHDGDWQNTWDPNWRYRIPGVVQIKYVGLHDLILSQARKRVLYQGRSNLRRRLREGMIGDIEFRKGMGALGNDMGPQWYDRHWFHSLPPEKGGAPLEQYTREVGWTLNIDEIPIVSWFYSQIKSLGDIWIENDHYYEGTEDGPDFQRPDRSPDLSKNDHDGLRVINPLPDLIVSRDRWYQGSTYHLRFKPSMKFRPAQGSKRIVDEISMKVLIELFWQKKEHFADLAFFVRHNIPDNNTTFTISLQLVNW